MNIRRDVSYNFTINKYTKVCSLHFDEDSFYPGDFRRSFEGKRRRKLKPDAEPTIFAWSRPVKKRKPPVDRCPPRQRHRQSSGACARMDTNVAAASFVELEDETMDGQVIHANDSGALPMNVESDVARTEVQKIVSTDTNGADSHSHCDCVEYLSAKVEALTLENSKLRAEAQLLQRSDTSTSKFSIDDIKEDDKLVSFYTGFQSFLMFSTCFAFLRRSAEVMRSWQGSRTTPEDKDRHGLKTGPKPKLPLIEQFFFGHDSTSSWASRDGFGVSI